MLFLFKNLQYFSLHMAYMTMWDLAFRAEDVAQRPRVCVSCARHWILSPELQSNRCRWCALYSTSSHPTPSPGDHTLAASPSSLFTKLFLVNRTFALALSICWRCSSCFSLWLAHSHLLGRISNVTSQNGLPWTPDWKIFPFPHRIL